MAQTLRDYQLSAIDSLRQKISTGKKRIVVVAPTGSGKTTLAAEIIRRCADKGNKVLFVAHRQELVYQAHNRLVEFGIDADIIMPPHRVNGHAVNIASLQTLVRRDKPHADIIFIDESHHISNSYKKILEHYKDKIVIGLTATPYRLDGKGLGEIYEDLIITSTIENLIESGHLVRPRYFGAKKDFSDIHIQAGDYNPKELFSMLDKKILYDGVVDKFRQFGKGKTLVFCVNIQHSLNTVEAFKNAGYKAMHIDCETDSRERQNIIDRFRCGEFDILSNCAIFTEGFDLPEITTVILNRATKSKCLFMQMVGRSLRPAPDKEHAIVIDHGNNVYEHGAVEWEEEYNLFPKKKKKKQSSADRDQPVKECPKCNNLLHSMTKTCPACGHVFPIEEKFVKAEFEEIVPKKKVIVPRHLRKPWSSMSDAELEEYRQLKSYKKGWVFYQKELRKERQALFG